MIRDLPSGNLLQLAIENGPVEIVDLPIKMVMFHSFLYVYQRVNGDLPIKTARNMLGKCWENVGKMLGTYGDLMVSNEIEWWFNHYKWWILW